jgi:hypothetical protein
MSSASSGTVAKLYLYIPSDLEAVVSKPCYISVCIMGFFFDGMWKL